MENAQAMDTQPAASEQLTEAALPAETAEEEPPTPIAAPPGVPVKAPPPTLLTKEEPKKAAPEISQLITLSEDSQVVRFTNGIIHLKQKGRDPETITPSMFEALVQTIRTQANAPTPSAMSGFTGLASTNRGSAPATDSDPIEWGDMDPNFRQALQNSPELLKAYNTVRNPKKVAKLDPATISFTPTTNIDLPPPSVETPPPQVTMENLSTVLAQYHEQTVQPSLDLLSNHIRQDVISRLDKQGSVIRYEGLALQSLEADAIRRTVLIHGLPPFTTKSQIDHNMHYLLQQAQLTDSDIQTTSNHVNTSTNAFMKITFLQESTSKHFFQTFKQKKRWYHSNEQEDAPLRIERDVLYLPDKHLSYACYLLVVPRFFEEELSTQLSKNPNFILQGYQSDMYRNQAEEEEDTEEDYKPKGGPKDRPDKWWKARDFAEYDPRFDDLVQAWMTRRSFSPVKNVWL
ncbi:hypothetical protein AK812_SmicGene32432 [Symbiodinium microadriaticum]|uniref:Uncharacterized protein n=1 Tax=Symbiodinium microadriaticum TaxID=2951 RepID=A0A1Q9CU50_SYMMI|nr:hypothetical protein AK812_SmicGene32432 [Symbiodinium microadriaticum]